MSSSNDADKQFNIKYALLAEGRYREWFYQGMDEVGRRFVKQPARDIEIAEADNYLINWESDQPRGWQSEAACKDADPEVFFVDEGQDPKRAYAKPDAEWRNLCPVCPVREQCLGLARESRSVGIFGGKVFTIPSKKSSSLNSIVEYDDTNLPPRGRPSTSPRNVKRRAETARKVKNVGVSTS